jgi:hypothetical protein
LKKLYQPLEKSMPRPKNKNPPDISSGGFAFLGSLNFTNSRADLRSERLGAKNRLPSGRNILPATSYG